MPIENERKYVLDPKNAAQYKQELLALPGAKAYSFMQGYLDNSCRIRMSTTHEITGNYSDCYFTYKTKVNGEQVEIESKIDHIDFKRLWTKVGKIVTKDRIKIQTYGYGDVWEVDFFTAANQPGYYLVMAEVELPPEQLAPHMVPGFIQKHLIHTVELHDKRFASKQLSKPATVADLLKQIRSGKLPAPGADTEE